MRSPDFWQRDGLVSRLLDPLGQVYGLAGSLRRAATRPWYAPVPVLCIGNLTVGGTGKTPLTIALAGRLARRGRCPHILSRGYGGRAKGPLRVDPLTLDAGAVGDEPLLLAAAAPTWVARDRRAGAEAALGAGADLLIMDDGFQNPSLHQDLALLAVDGTQGFGNRRLLPAGPLREPVTSGLERAGAVVIVGEDRARVGRDLPAGLPLLRARFRAIGGQELAGARALAFAGIGRPEKFYETLRAVGVELVACCDFPDHHPYRPSQLHDLLARADAQRAMAVTTAKDLVRIPHPLRPRFRALDIELEIEPEAVLDELLDRFLGSLPIT